MSYEPKRARIAVAALVFAGAACASYAAQRLIDAGSEPPLGSVLHQATIPYYWRVSISLVHAAAAATLVAVALPAAGAPRALAALRWVVPAVVVPAAIAMALVP